jgi:hypothetical protein
MYGVWFIALFKPYCLLEILKDLAVNMSLNFKNFSKISYNIEVNARMTKIDFKLDNKLLDIVRSSIQSLTYIK